MSICEVALSDQSEVQSMNNNAVRDNYTCRGWFICPHKGVFLALVCAMGFQFVLVFVGFAKVRQGIVGPSEDSDQGALAGIRASGNHQFPTIKWPKNIDSAQLRCEGARYMETLVDFKICRDKVVARALYADEEKNYIFVFRVFTRKSFGWTQVGEGRLLINKMDGNYRIVERQLTEETSVNLMECGRSTGREIRETEPAVEVVVYYGRCVGRFYLNPLSELR